MKKITTLILLLAVAMPFSFGQDSDAPLTKSQYQQLYSKVSVQGKRISSINGSLAVIREDVQHMVDSMQDMIWQQQAYMDSIYRLREEKNDDPKTSVFASDYVSTESLEQLKEEVQKADTANEDKLMYLIYGAGGAFLILLILIVLHWILSAQKLKKVNLSLTADMGSKINALQNEMTEHNEKLKKDMQFQIDMLKREMKDKTESNRAEFGLNHNTLKEKLEQDITHAEEARKTDTDDMKKALDKKIQANTKKHADVLKKLDAQKKDMEKAFKSLQDEMGTFADKLKELGKKK